MENENWFVKIIINTLLIVSITFTYSLFLSGIAIRHEGIGTDDIFSVSLVLAVMTTLLAEIISKLDKLQKTLNNKK